MSDAGRKYGLWKIRGNGNKYAIAREQVSPIPDCNQVEWFAFHVAGLDKAKWLVEILNAQYEKENTDGNANHDSAA